MARPELEAHLQEPADSSVRILGSKLRAPLLRPTSVPRPRLVERLREGRGLDLTLVSAPAGYGKTTLLAQWLAEDSQTTPFAWVSLEESDADPVRLWMHLIRALQPVHRRVGERSETALASAPGAVAEVVVPLVLTELEDSPPLVLVLEDWHRVGNPACDASIRTLLDHAPGAVQVVVSSRCEPEICVARRRACGQLLELRAADLRLTVEEASALFDRLRLHLDDSQVEALAERTEGWAAGLQLASILVPHEVPADDFVSSFSGESRPVADYIAADVLESIAPELRAFLLRSSILDRLTAPLCDAVLETTGSAERLREIEDANLFLVPLDDRRESYRYHQLFAAVLRRELEREEPESVGQLHARAAAWLDAHGDGDAAVEHAILSRDVRLASDLATTYLRGKWNSGQMATLLRWLGALSWPEARRDPQLAVMRAVLSGLTARPVEEIERWLDVAQAGVRLGPLANGMASLEAGVALARSVFLTHGVTEAIACGERAVELERSALGWRRPALLALAQALYLGGRPEEARAVLDEARRLPAALEQRAAASMVLAYLALSELDAGRPEPAERFALQVFPVLGEVASMRGLAAGNAHLVLGKVLAGRGELHAALDELDLAAALCEPGSPSVWHAHALLRRAEIRHALGDVEAARADFAAATDELEGLPDPGAMLTELRGQVERLVLNGRREHTSGGLLSRRELDVLLLLATELSRREIAGSLYVSLNTVKTHTRAIYRKLGASSRSEALSRAVALGLLAG